MADEHHLHFDETGGIKAEWENVSYPINRTLMFHDHGVDGIELAAVCAVRCKRCSRFIAWVYDHPSAGYVLVRRVDLNHPDSSDNPLREIAALVRGHGGGNVKADADSLLYRLDQLTEYPAWCVECRAWREVRTTRLRAALAAGENVIRV